LLAQQQAMLSNLKALFRPSPSTSSTSNVNPNVFPPSSSSITTNQFPFSTNPARVKKSRHNNHPKYLPRPDASVGDVRYFLYTLLTSKLNDCAKKYPEWVLETCMGWNGDGEQLRNSTEEQLETLCPITAVAVGIDSHKHKPGAFVPIPARHMIGEAISRFVLDKRDGEHQPHNIQRRLQEERSRSCSGRRVRTALEAVHDINTPRTVSPASHPLSRSRSMNLPQNLDGPPLDFPTPSTWIALTHQKRDSTPPLPTATVSPTASISNSSQSIPNSSHRAISVTSSEPENSESSHSIDTSAEISPTKTSPKVQTPADLEANNQLLPDAPLVLSTSIPCASSSFSASSNDKEQHLPQPQPKLETNWPLNVTGNGFNDSVSTAEAGVNHFHLPLRYAPRPSPALPTSCTTSSEASNRLFNTMPSHRISGDALIRKDFGLLVPVQTSGVPRRRSSLALRSKCSIPEIITEELNENSRTENDVQETLRHDSGMDESLRTQHIPNNYSPQMINSTAPCPPPAGSSNTSNGLQNVSGFDDDADSNDHKAWSAPRSCNTSPLANAKARPVSATLRRCASAAPVLSRSSTSSTSNSSNGHIGTNAVEDWNCGRSAINTSTMSGCEALEAHFLKVEQLREMASTRITRRGLGLQRAKSNTTLYSAPASMQTPNSNHPLNPPVLPLPFTRHQSLSIRTRPTTLIDVIEEKERLARMPLNLRNAWTGHQQSMPRNGLDSQRTV
jgi:hypothetical protein